MPFARALLSVERNAYHKASGKTDLGLRYFITSHDPNRAAAPALLQAVRLHWSSVENKNHNRRDALTWAEDRWRIRHPTAMLNLGLLRAGLQALLADALPDVPLPEVASRVRARVSLGIHLIRSHGLT